MRTPRHLVALAIVAALALGACSSDQDPAVSSGDATTTTADGNETDATDDPGADTGAIPEPGPGEGGTVFINTFIYRPDPLTVPAGTTVTWIQNDSTVHTVTSGTREAGPDGMFDASLDKGEEFSFTFDEPGTYDYFCTLHSGPGMTGEVIVE
jgi:plastocyanin